MCLAIGNKSLWANIICILESETVTPVCTSSCAPAEVLSLFLNWNLGSFAKIARCQAGSFRPVRIDLRWFPCFLSVGDPVASFDSWLPQLQIPWTHHHAASAPRIWDWQYWIDVSGAQPWISIIQLNSLNVRFIQIVNSAFSARSVCEASHTENLSTVFLSVHNGGKRLDRDLRER